MLLSTAILMLQECSNNLFRASSTSQPFVAAITVLAVDRLLLLARKQTRIFSLIIMAIRFSLQHIPVEDMNNAVVHWLQKRIMHRVKKIAITYQLIANSAPKVCHVALIKIELVAHRWIQCINSKSWILHTNVRKISFKELTGQRSHSLFHFVVVGFQWFPCISTQHRSIPNNFVVQQLRWAVFWKILIIVSIY